MINKIRQERGNQLFRLLDRYLGILVIGILRPFKRKKSFGGKVNFAGILKTAAIGDTVLISAIAADLRKKYPAARIIFFAGGSNFEFAKTIREFNEVILLPVNNPFKAVKLLRKYRFDVFLDFGPWPRLDAILAFFSKSAFTVGFKTPGQHRHYLYDQTVAHSNMQHEMENFRNLAGIIGLESASLPRLAVDAGESRSILQEKRHFVVFHPWPGGVKSYLKEWPLQNWVELAQRMLRSGYHVFITGAPADSEKSRQIVNMVEGGADSITSLAGKSSLADTIALLSRADLVVSVNTGIMHIGAALDVPLIALHGPTSPKRWGPLGKKSVIISPRIPGCGYLNLGFEYPPDPPDCMGAITVEEVFERAKAILRL